MKIKINIFIAIVLLVFGAVLVRAEENIDQFEKVNPQQELQYGLKRIKEKFILLISFTKKQKVNYSLKLTDIRFRELIYVVRNKDTSQIEKVSQRYETLVGQLTDLLLLGNEEVSRNIFIDKIKLHKEILEASKDTFGYDTSEYRFVMNDINSIDIYLKKLLSR